MLGIWIEFSKFSYYCRIVRNYKLKKNRKNVEIWKSIQESFITDIKVAENAKEVINWNINDPSYYKAPNASVWKALAISLKYSFRHKFNSKRLKNIILTRPLFCVLSKYEFILLCRSGLNWTFFYCRTFLPVWVQIDIRLYYLWFRSYKLTNFLKIHYS